MCSSQFQFGSTLAYVNIYSFFSLIRSNYFDYTKSGMKCPSYNFLNTANNVGDEMSAFRCKDPYHTLPDQNCIAEFAFLDRSTPYPLCSSCFHRLAGSCMFDSTVGFVSIIPLLVYFRVFVSSLSFPLSFFHRCD